MKHARLRTLLALAGTALLAAATGAGADPIRFAVLGDTQGLCEAIAVNDAVFSKIVAAVLATDPPVDFVVVCGDLVDGTKDDEVLLGQYAHWRQVAGPWYEAGLPVYVLPGNHDLANRETYALLWRQSFPELPDNGPAGEETLYYSFDAGPVHLSMVSTSSPPARDRVNVEWLRQDLDAADRPIKLVFGHEPAYPYFFHVGESLDVHPEARDAFWQTLIDEGAWAYFCGHEHYFNHWYHDGVHQIITGGGGGLGIDHHYLIVEADAAEVAVSVHEISGELRRRFTLSEIDGVDRSDRDDPQAQIARFGPCAAPFFALGVVILAGADLLQRRGN